MISPLIITGAYGSGKTECAMALAVQEVRHTSVTLLDLDFVNPYFRSQDHRTALEAQGVDVIGPEADVAAIDAPAMPPAARDALVNPAGLTIVDLGGDPAGAIVLGQFAPAMTNYDMWGVVNFARPTTATPAMAAQMLRDIEVATRLRITGLVSNTHFAGETTSDDVLAGWAKASELSALLSVPVVLIGVPATLPPPQLPTPILRISPRLLRPWQI